MQTINMNGSYISLSALGMIVDALKDGGSLQITGCAPAPDSGIGFTLGVLVEQAAQRKRELNARSE